MSWNVRPTNAPKGDGSGRYPKAPPGSHPAVLVAMVDMGTHDTGFTKDSGAPQIQRKLWLLWELVSEEIPGTGRNHLIDAAVTFSLNEKATLRKWIEARTGKPLSENADHDILSELGQPCLLNVVMQGDYPKVGSVGGVPRGFTIPAPKNTPIAVSLDDYRERGADAIPAWVNSHWHYGRPIAEHVKECDELKPAAANPF